MQPRRANPADKRAKKQALDIPVAVWRWDKEANLGNGCSGGMGCCRLAQKADAGAGQDAPLGRTDWSGSILVQLGHLCVSLMPLLGQGQTRIGRCRVCVEGACRSPQP
jgi:hypothetical protein